MYELAVRFSLILLSIPCIMQVMESRYSFRWHGGTQDSSRGYQSTHKFLVFPVVEGKEMFLSEAVKYGIVNPCFRGLTYESISPHVKLFYLHTTPNMGQIIQSFYMEISREEETNLITIKHPAMVSWEFSCHGRFLKKSEILAILSADNPSVDFVKKERTAPRDYLKTIITIEKPRMILPAGRRVTLGGVKKKKRR